MPSTPKPDAMADQASLSTNPRRLSIVGSLRRRTSRIFHRNATAPIATTTASTPDNVLQPLQPQSPKGKRRWFHSVGARFHRQHNQTILESSEGSQEAQVELDETAGPACPPFSPETSPSQSSVRRRLFSSRRFKLRSLPTRSRRQEAVTLSRSWSPSDEDKENFTAVAVARSVHASHTGSWSSFRSGVQRAVRESVDSDFRFANDRSTRNATPRSSARAPLGTLWTIMSADSSEGQSSDPKPTTPEQPKKYELSSPNWSPDWSPTSSTKQVPASPSCGSGASDSGLTRSGSTPDCSPIPSPAREVPAQDGSVVLVEVRVDEENMPEVYRDEDTMSGRSGEVADYDAEEQREMLRGEMMPRVVAHPSPQSTVAAGFWA